MRHAPARLHSRDSRQLRPGRLGAALAAALTLLTVGLGLAALAPEPDPVPRRWQLDVEPGRLRAKVVTTEAGESRTYLYFTYTVTNNSGDDRLFAPKFELSSNKGDLLRSGREVPLEVTTAIKESLENPMVEDQIKIIGTIAQGKENAKDGVVIWPVETMDPDEVTIYAGGFSGETATVDVPGTKDKKVLRKTLMIRYKVPGDLARQGSTPLDESERRWIMR